MRKRGSKAGRGKAERPRKWYGARERNATHFQAAKTKNT